MKSFPRVLVGVLCASLLLLTVSAGLARCGEPGVAAAEKPRLAVLVVFDQFRGDYLQRWGDLFGADGFRRLTQDGAWFQNCHYPYASTETGPGHASLLTGCSADRHGIITNNWYDRTAGRTVYCVTAERYEVVPPQPPVKNERGAGTPERLLVPTVGDVLKEATAGKGRVVSLSFKDRSAILPAGRRPDACYWAHTDTATFVTSTYYRDRPHDWVTQFNQSGFVKRWFGKSWTKLRLDLDYEKYSGPDDVAAEATGIKQGRTFPHPYSAGLTKPGRDYYKALYTAPAGNEILLELVKRAILAEGLGTRDIPDLLCVSFSTNDPIGHSWGPDSQEVLDTTLRSDLIVKELLAYLDAKVGRGRYVLGLAADHGVAPLLDVARAQGKDAGKIAPELIYRPAEEFLQKQFGKPGESVVFLARASYPALYLDQPLLERRGLKAAVVEEALAGWLKQQPGILTAYTRTQLVRGVPADDVLGQRVRRSFYPARSGDVFFVVKPYHQLSGSLLGTGHGTPHPYDTHVPLIVFGAGVRAGPRTDAVTPQALAPILAHALGLKPPSATEARLPDNLFLQP